MKSFLVVGIVLFAFGGWTLYRTQLPKQPVGVKAKSTPTPAPTASPTPKPLYKESDEELTNDPRFHQLADRACEAYGRSQGTTLARLWTWDRDQHDGNKITLHCKKEITGEGGAAIFTDFSNNNDVEIAI